VPASLSFPRSRRLAHDLEYQAVYGARLKKSRGPLTVFAVPNSLSHPRLGLSVGRRAGGAVERSRLKRLLREAFRLSQHDLPRHEGGNYDLVLSSKPHEPLPLADYQRILIDLAAQLHAESERRDRRRSEKAKDAP
jgi:ribonuclease P protein component